jgi:2-dehydro-3-deoxyphosphogluconate aldolase/(4S)-4-hydroxy-2-oxoglutarate aldolase
MTTGIELVLRRPVIPVLTVDDVEVGVQLAQALARAGLDVLEVTLRTDVALEAVRAMVAYCPDALIGVGTVNTPAQLEEAIDAGAQFAVSPGVTPRLLDAFTDAPVPWLPAAGTISESLVLLDRGWCYQKLFPANVVGGVDYLDAIRAPVPEVTFCPTGGLNAKNAPDFLARVNVACVGGSWVAPKAAVAAGDWDEVVRIASLAAGLERAWDGAQA